MATAPAVAFTPSTIEASRRREILQRHAALAGQGDYEVLGVRADANRETIKSAYQRLARRFHPDALGLHSSDFADKTQAIFVRATEAYRVLSGNRAEASAWVSDPPRVPSLPSVPAREDGRAARNDSQPRTAASNTAFADGADREPPLRPPVPVDEVLWEAKRCLDENDAEGAVSLLHGVVTRAKGAESRRVRRLLARAYAQEPKWRRYAVGQLRTLIDECPEDAEALSLLGAVYRHEGLLSRAEATLRRALAADPGLSEARSMLRAVSREREATRSSEAVPAPPRPGLVMRLFRRQS